MMVSPLIWDPHPTNFTFEQFVELYVYMYKIWVTITSWSLFLLIKGYMSFSCYPNALRFERFISLCKCTQRVHFCSKVCYSWGNPHSLGYRRLRGFFFLELGLRDVCKMIYVCTKASLRRLKWQHGGGEAADLALLANRRSVWPFWKNGYSCKTTRDCDPTLITPNAFYLEPHKITYNYLVLSIENYNTVRPYFRLHGLVTLILTRSLTSTDNFKSKVISGKEKSQHWTV